MNYVCPPALKESQTGGVTIFKAVILVIVLTVTHKSKQSSHKYRYKLVAWKVSDMGRLCVCACVCVWFLHTEEGTQQSVV